MCINAPRPSHLAITLAMTAALILPIAASPEAKPFKEMFPDVTFKNEKAQQLVDGLDYQQGTIPLNTGGIQLKVPPRFYFLSAEHAKRVVVDIWGNPPTAANGVLGMILPADKTPVDDTWGAIITYDDDGYVADDEAGKIDYTELLKSMQSSTAESNDERVKAGFPSIKLIGWASPPFYDKATNKLHWAKELEFGGSPKHTLNYDVRALGRRGVLKMNFVAGMEDLAAIKDVIPAVVGMPEFQDGWRYQDYVASTDKVAAYGIGGLIAGKLLAKAGFLAIALAFLKKGWIVIFLFAGALWNFFKRRLSRRTPPQG